MDRPKALSVAAMLVLLTGCGGGGDSAQTPPPVTPPVNQAPSLTSLRFELDEDSTLSAQLTATDPEGQPVSFSKAAEPAQGTATVSSSGALTYVPVANYSGTITLNITVADSAGAQATASVSLVVKPVNDAPVARDDELRVPTGAPVTLSLLANDTDLDNDALSVSILSQARGGVVSVSAGNVVTLTPEGNYSGPMVITYRITDAAGVTADATARLVVGNFAGIIYLADETTPGVLDLMYYNGLRAVRANAPLESGFVLKRFALSGDGRRVAYVASGSTFDRVFVADLSTPGVARAVHVSSSRVNGQTGSTFIRINFDGTRVLVGDAIIGMGTSWWVADGSGIGSSQRVGSGNPEIVQYSNATFGGTASDLWVVAQVGGSPPPMSGTGSNAVYRGSASAPGTLQQVGATYPGNNGQGSGINLRVSPDGQTVLHGAVTYTNSGSFYDLLTLDRNTNAEAYLYRKFGAFEWPVPLEFDINNTSDAVCFRLNQPGSSSVGPGRFYVANPKTPGAATPVTAVADINMNCQWASDGRRMAFFSGTSAPGGVQWRVVDRLAPLAVSVLNAPMAAGESIGTGMLARKRSMGIYSVSPSTGPIVSLHRVNLDQAGQATRLLASWQPTFLPEGQSQSLNPEGTLLAYAKGSPRPRLFMISTETAEYEIALTRSDALLGVLQAEWVTEP